MLSVTIVNHESREQLGHCIEALREHPYSGPMEIVVIDNASVDDTVGMLRREYPEVVVVAKQRRRGFGANQNEAVSVASGEILLILNPDAIVHERTIDRLVDALGWKTDVVASGGPILEEDGTPRQDRPFPLPSPAERIGKAVGLRRSTRSPAPESHVFSDGWLSGGAFVIDRAAFLGIGGFDEDYFMYAEDADLFARMSGAGYRFAWVTDAVVTHPHANEDPQAAARRATESVRGELRFARTHHHRIGAFFYRCAVVVDSTIRLAALSLPGLRRTVRLHGTSPGQQRAIHRHRIATALGVGRVPGLAEEATRWNGDNAPSAL